jgi:hypothetical protein
MLQAGRSPVRVSDEVDFFNLPNPSNRTMALGSTQPLTEMSTRNFPGDKSGRRIGLTTLQPSVSRMSENVGTSTSRNPKASTACLGITLPLPVKTRKCSFVICAGFLIGHNLYVTQRRAYGHIIFLRCLS